MSETTGWAALDQLLAVDPADSGCGHAMKVMHAYAELLAAGEDATLRYPDVAAHLRTCSPCQEDLTGIIVLITSPEDRIKQPLRT